MAIKLLDELLRDAPDNEPSLIEPGLLPFAGRMFLYGFPGVGKSLLALQLAFEAACALPWLGVFDITKPCRVFYLQCELPEGKFIERVARMVRAYPNVPSTQMGFMTSRSIKVGNNGEGWHELLHEMANWQPDLWLIDPEYKVFVGDENRSADMQLFYDTLDGVAELLGCAVVLVSHRRKTQFDEAGSRRDAGYLEIPGSQRRVAWADTVARLQSNRKGKQLLFEKTRYDEAPENVVLEFDSTTLCHRGQLHAALDDVILAQAQSGVAHKSLMELLLAMNYSESTIRRTLERMEQEGVIRLTPIQGDKRAKEVRTVG